MEMLVYMLEDFISATDINKSEHCNFILQLGPVYGLSECDTRQGVASMKLIHKLRLKFVLSKDQV